MPAKQPDHSHLLNPRTLAVVAIILAVAATRLVPLTTGMWNFTAVGAVCLFGGAYLTRRWLAFLVPLAALLVSDVGLAALVYGWDTLPQVWLNYVLFAATVGIGTWLRGRVAFVPVTAAAMLATAMFYLVSNFHYWLVWGNYPLTPAGLLACYIAALPFAGKMLLGNLFYSGLLFGGFELLSWRVPAMRPACQAELVPVRA